MPPKPDRTTTIVASLASTSALAPDPSVAVANLHTDGAKAGETSSGAAQQNSRRYAYMLQRGHTDYCVAAKRNDDFYLGAGLQWDAAVKAELEAQGRPASEVNEILPAVNAAVGYQIANRMDVTAMPNGHGADDTTATAINLMFRAELGRMKFRWGETQVFEDGLIQQRGFYRLRMTTTENMQGQAELTILDPMDVIPDPDAKTYDPDGWGDVMLRRWLTADEVGDNYGEAAKTRLLALDPAPDRDYGDGDDDGTPHNRFGNDNTGGYDARMEDGDIVRYRVLDRQHHVHAMSNVAIYETGDVVPIDDTSVEELRALRNQPGVVLTRRQTKRVRWTVSAGEVLLHDDWSPYKHFDIIPFFPYFRRGRTRGLVDNAISPQETMNKATAQVLHIVNSTANSGWIYEEGSLTNMEGKDLEDRGASTGLNLEIKKGATPPQKIKPNEVPTGLTQLVGMMHNNIQAVTSINESMLGADASQDMSGVAIQSRQFAAQQALARPLDNLAQTRYMLSTHLLEFFQKYYIDSRKFRFTEMDQFGKPKTTEASINDVQADGSVLNDMTIGHYDITIASQPMQVTFDNSQFEQIKSMRKDMGVQIPDAIVIRYSNLSDKTEVVEAIAQQAAQQGSDPLASAKAGTEQAKQGQLAAAARVADANVALINANAELARANAVNVGVTGMYSATRAGAEIAAMPQVAPLADELLKSAGFVDKDAPPIVPAPGAGQGLTAPPPSESTHPLTPPHPDVGVNAGIEAPTGVPAP